METALTEKSIATKTATYCHHCGEKCEDVLKGFGYDFCCQGCLTVYDILSSSGMEKYYCLEEKPGIAPETKLTGRYSFLADATTASRLYTFENSTTAQVELSIPAIHCISCVWLLENLSRLNDSIIRSEVNFGQKTTRILFRKEKANLQDIAVLLAGLGYEVDFNLADLDKQNKNQNRSLIAKIAVAGFCFGNIMLFSFPHYLGLEISQNSQTANFFSIMNLILAIPLILYSGNDYLKSALNTFKHGTFSLDLPIFLGIIALFFQSSYEILKGTGAGYMDSLAGLVFFLLLGRYFQQKTYDRLSFERDYKSFFPLWCTLIKDGKEESTPVDKLVPGNRLRIRSGELIPADSVLINNFACVDYPFVTGESDTQSINPGEKIFAGGRQVGSAIEVEVTSGVDHSYLTKLWQNTEFEGKKDYSLINRQAGFYFTIVISTIAILSSSYHFIFSNDISPLKVFTSVVIIACPCALALSAPLSFGFATRVLSKFGLFLKDSAAIEQLSRIQNIVFDKTGTLTEAKIKDMIFEGSKLTEDEEQLIAALVSHSGHPVSRQLAKSLPQNDLKVTDYKELKAKGVMGFIDGTFVRIGKPSWINPELGDAGTAVEIDCIFRGIFHIQSTYRNGLQNMLNNLKQKLFVLSGDSNTEERALQKLFPQEIDAHFNQSPQQKLEFINSLKTNNDTLMLGDGLNDAGALQVANAGIAVADDIHAFFPACDGILKADKLAQLDQMLTFSKRTMKLIHFCFAISLLYNTIGLSFAVAGKLTPLVSAILMPISSLSILIIAAAGIALIKTATFKKEKSL